jgi:lipopolysaccharide/colanic/teichoic acid biosynthesis glycosyltransferase
MTRHQEIMKRTFDITFAFLGLLLFGWLIVGCFFIVLFSTGMNGFFIQERVGRKGRLFPLVKIRTMRNIPEETSTVTTSGDGRITMIGKILRKTKLDELPQLWNVLLGQMSFVGPRPDVPGFADSLKGESRQLLKLRPGITGPASLYFRKEEQILADVEDPESFNEEVIWPIKVSLNLNYIHNYSFKWDIIYILQTILGGGQKCHSKHEIIELRKNIRSF